MNAKLFGRNRRDVHRERSRSPATGYKTLTISYTRQMNFLLLPGPNVTLTRSKKVYTVV